MRAAVIGAGAGFGVETLPDPSPGPGELVLRVTGCGICGSDLKMRSAMAPGTVMGHELCGEVVAVGAGVEGWRAGTRAAVLPVFSCGACPACRAGDVALCPQAALLGVGGAPGGFAEYVRASAAHTFALPDALPPAFGPLVEPFAVALHAARTAAVGPDDRVLVVGGGTIGLATAAWARALGAAAVTLSDPLAHRREAAARLGATAVVDPTAEEVGGPYEVVVECVGKPGMLDVCAGAAGTHGRVVMAGLCIEPDPFLPLTGLLKELSIRFAVYYRPDEFAATVEAFAAGRIDPAPLLSRTVGLGQLDAAFASLVGDTAELKIVVDPAA